MATTVNDQDARRPLRRMRPLNEMTDFRTGDAEDRRNGDERHRDAKPRRELLRVGPRDPGSAGFEPCARREAGQDHAKKCIDLLKPMCAYRL